MRFRSFTLTFDKMNLIFGNVGTGKTSIIQSIAAMFNRVPNVRSMLNNVGTEGKITLDVIQENQRVLALKRNLAPQTFTKEDVKCILIDDTGYLTDTGFSTLLSDSRTWHTQVIIASQPRELEFIPSCYNIIRLQPSD
jgi:DNA repair exonuclease SbcCD ATPase subunit